jgi:hypothetical protein
MGGDADVAVSLDWGFACHGKKTLIFQPSLRLKPASAGFNLSRSGATHPSKAAGLAGGANYLSNAQKR